MSSRYEIDSNSEDSKRKRDGRSPESIFTKSKITRRTPVKKREENKTEMDELKEMLTDMMGEIKQIKKNQIDQGKKMEQILKENAELKNHIQKLDKKIEKLDKKVEQLEKEKKKNNLIITGYEPRTKDNLGLKYELEDFSRVTLKVETKIRNAKRIGDKICVIEMDNWEEKVKILKAKSTLRNIAEPKIYINNDLTDKEKEIQAYIKEIEKKEKGKGNKTKMGYKKLMINGKKWEWNNEKQELMETKFLNSKN